MPPWIQIRGKRGNSQQTDTAEEGQYLPGPNRVNFDTIRRYTLAVANWLIHNGRENDGVVVGRDTRIGSKSFLEETVRILRIKGIKVCRQTKGVWKEEYDKRTNPMGKEYYWLTGAFDNFEPNATDTDEWALKNNYIAIVPVQIDTTSYQELERLKKWNFNELQ
jgi:hypothetical protein